MARIFRILAIFITCFVGAAAAFGIFTEVDHFISFGISGGLFSRRILFLLLTIFFALTAVLTVFFQVEILNLIRVDSSETDLIDNPGEPVSSASRSAFKKPVHWVFWSGNFAFAVGLVRLSVFLFDEVSRSLPMHNLPAGLDRYLFILGLFLFGLLLIYDGLVLLRDYIRTPVAR